MYGWESWTIKKAEHWRIDAFELWCWRRLLRVPWTARRSNQSNLKEMSSEYSLEGSAEAEAPILWPPDVKNWLTGKVPDAGKDWRREEKGTTEDEMAGWHHRLDGHKFEQAPGVRDGQGGLACCSPWGHQQSDMTELNWTLGDSGCYNAPFTKGKLRLKTAFANYSMSQSLNKSISSLSLLSWKFVLFTILFTILQTGLLTLSH